MSEYSLGLHFLFGMLSTAGFCFLFHVPKKHFLFAAISGGFGWLTFQYMLLHDSGNITSCFLGACVVAVVAEIFSRAGREATTLFVIPGILPLVPGAGMYNTMLLFLEKDLNAAAATGSETIMMAGSIAIALLVIASITRLINAIILNIIAFIKSKRKQPVEEIK